MLPLHNKNLGMFIQSIIKRVPTGLFTAIVLGLIAYVSLDGDPFDANRVKLFEGADKVIHAIMYFTLVSVMLFDSAKKRFPKKMSALVVLACATLAFAYSVLMEYLQDVMGIGRSASIYDAIANLIGVLLGCAAMKYYFLGYFDKILRSKNV